MQMKRKRFWIVFTSVVLGIVLILTGTFLLTRLKTVNVEFRTKLSAEETRLAEGITEKIKTSGEFDYGACLLFANFDESITKIEKANPYVKVEQIMRKFPNKLHIYVSEREPKYRIKDKEIETKWYILDIEFKVLEVVDDIDNSSLKNETVELEHISETLYVGDFLANETERTYMSNILAGVYGRTKDITIISSIKHSAEENKFYISMKANKDGEFTNGCVMQIEGTDKLTEKVHAATCAYCKDDYTDGSVDLSQKVIVIVESKDGGFKGKLENE